MRRLLLALCAAFAGPPLAAEGGGPPLTSLYDCGGLAVLVRMGEGGEGASMRIGDRIHALVPALSASGARFEADDDPSTLFWSKGLAATVTLSGRDLPPCRIADDPGWSAAGNEPFWTASLRGLTLTLDRLGEVEQVVRLAGPVWRDGALLLEGEGVRLRSLAMICHDSMTGMPYPETVEIATGGQTLDGCGGDPAVLLAGGEWAVESIDGVPPAAGALPTLTFDETGGVAGSGGCNRWSARYSLTGEGLSFAPPVATRIACDTAVMRSEERFFAALAGVAGFDIDSRGALHLLSSSGSARIVARR